VRNIFAGEFSPPQLVDSRRGDFPWQWNQRVAAAVECLLSMTAGACESGLDRREAYF
jgi:hypothetical protein